MKSVREVARTRAQSCSQSGVFGKVVSILRSTGQRPGYLPRLASACAAGSHRLPACTSDSDGDKCRRWWHFWPRMPPATSPARRCMWTGAARPRTMPTMCRRMPWIGRHLRALNPSLCCEQDVSAQMQARFEFHPADICIGIAG